MRAWVDPRRSCRGNHRCRAVIAAFPPWERLGGMPSPGRPRVQNEVIEAIFTASTRSPFGGHIRRLGGCVFGRESETLLRTSDLPGDELGRLLVERRLAAVHVLLDQKNADRFAGHLAPSVPESRAVLEGVAAM